MIPINQSTRGRVGAAPAKFGWLAPFPPSQLKCGGRHRRAKTHPSRSYLYLLHMGHMDSETHMSLEQFRLRCGRASGCGRIISCRSKKRGRGVPPASASVKALRLQFRPLRPRP
jgi:hypothetical protein